MSRAKPLEAAAVVERAGQPPAEYLMFEVRELSAAGARLSGPIVLEVGESLALRLAGPEPLDLRAVVEAVSPERHMRVRFSGLSEADAARLAALSA